MPTILGLCGIDSPDCQGTDFSEDIVNKKDINNEAVYLQNLGNGWPTRSSWVGFWRGIKTERFTYARTMNNWLDGERILLLDSDNHSLERVNCIKDPKYKEIAERMENELRQKISQYDDPFDTGERIENYGMLKLNQELTDIEVFSDTLPKELRDYLMT